jgi:maleate cis-trans isomerase
MKKAPDRRVDAVRWATNRSEQKSNRGGTMFESDVPKHKIGVLHPLAVIDNSPYEFYRLAPPRVMLVMLPVGLQEFTAKDVERVFAPLDGYLDQLMERGIDLVMQNGVPLPILIGLAAHDRMVAHMAQYTGKPATTTVLSVVHAARDMGIRKLALANKWSDAMNKMLGDFFAREGVQVRGAATRELSPAEFQKIKTSDNLQLAYDLGRRAFLDNPDCDAVYVGGGAWLAEPAARQLEAEFGKPVLCNQTSAIREMMRLLNDWKPIVGHGRVLATP